MSFRKNLAKFDNANADEWLTKHDSKSKKDPNIKVGARYFPKVDTTKLDKKYFPNEVLPIRILPGRLDRPYQQWSITLVKYNMTKWKEEIAKRAGIDPKIVKLFDEGKIYGPESINPTMDKNNPLVILRSALYKEGSERSRACGKKLFPTNEHFCNGIARSLMLTDDNDQEKLYKNVGPRVLRLTDGPMDKIIKAFKNPDIGDPTDVDEAYDFLYYMEKRKMTIKDDNGKEKEVEMPQYDKCDFARRLTAAAPDEKTLEDWMENIPNLLDEYKETPMRDIEIIADIIEKIAFDKSIPSVHPVTENINKPDDEVQNDDDDDVEPVTRKARVVEPEDEPPPARTRKPVPVDDEDPPASRRRSTPVDDEDPPPARTRKSAPVDDEDPPPARTRKPAPTDDEDTPPARTRKPADDDDNEPPPARTRKPAPADDEETPPATRRRQVTDDDEPKTRARVTSGDDNDEWLQAKIDAAEERRAKK